MEQVKVKRIRNSKYKTHEERREAKNKCNIKSYHKRKHLKKLRIKLHADTGNFDKVYQQGLFSGLKDIDYNVFVTLTNHDIVSKRKHNSNVLKLLVWLEKRHYIKRTFKVDEIDGGNYHSHVLLEVTEFVRSIAGIIKKYWEEYYGYVDVVRIDGQESKEKIIKYCLKQLRPTCRNNQIQELIDSWDLREVEFESIVNAAPVDLFKNEAFLSSIRSSKTRKCFGTPELLTEDVRALPDSTVVPGSEIINKKKPISDLLGIY